MRKLTIYYVHAYKQPKTENIILETKALLTCNTKICYDNVGKVSYKGGNFNTQIFWKMYLFVFV